MPSPRNVAHTDCTEAQHRFGEAVTHTKSTRVSSSRAGPAADLGAKNLGDEGLAYVAFSLPYNNRLDALDLSKNGLTAKGAATLAETLAQNSHLAALSLDTNGVGDEGAAALAAVLASNFSLKSLNLSANGIGKERREGGLPLV